MKQSLLILIALLIFFPEASLDTSQAIEKNNLYSIYFYKLFGLSLADYLILTLFLFTFFSDPIGKLKLGIIWPIFYVYVFYIILGIFYNWFVAFEMKALLYDIKATLYLFVPYIALKNFFDDIVINENHVYLFAFIYIIGSFYDAIYVNYFLSPEYSSIIGLPLVYEIMPITVLFGIAFLTSYSYTKMLFVVFFLWEVVSSFNRGNIGNIFRIGLAISTYLLVRIKQTQATRIVSFILFFYLIVIALPIVLYYINIPFFGDIKKLGWEIRRLEVVNFFLNAIQNFPIFIGKGLGSTWTEIVSTGGGIYSYGPFQYSDNKFIWHNTLAGAFYKFGVLGSLLLIYFLSTIASKLVTNYQKMQNKIPLLLAYLVIVFVMSNVNGIGILKGALLSSIILFMCDRVLASRTK